MNYDDKGTWKEAAVIIGLGLAAILTIFMFFQFFHLLPPAEAQGWNTTALDTWCGKPTGEIRMIGGWEYDKNTLEDEQGNLWGWDGELDENAFYLLWIDDVGTPQTEDDVVIKVWQEAY